MYLFLPARSRAPLSISKLYIPQCIYFYNAAVMIACISALFTFHNVSISTDAGYLITNMFMRFTFHNVSISTPSNLLTLKYSDYIPCFVDFLPYINSITNLYL